MVQRRRDRKIERANEIANYKNETKQIDKRGIHDMLGLRRDQPLSDLINKQGLTTKIGLDERLEIMNKS